MHACVYIIMYFIIDCWTYNIPMAWAGAGTGVSEEGKSFSTPRMYISAMDWGWGEREEEGEIPDQWGKWVESVRITLPPTRGVLVVKTSSSSGVDMTHGAEALTTTTNDDDDDAAEAGAVPASGGGAAAAAPCRTSAAAATATVEPGSTPAASFNAASRGGCRSLGSQGTACWKQRRHG